jgi:hypothetical protein
MGAAMKAGAVLTVALPTRFEGTPVTVILVGKSRLVVELPNGSQIWVKDPDLKRRGRRARAA